MSSPLSQYRELPRLRQLLVRLILVTVVLVLFGVWEIGVWGDDRWGVAVAIVSVFGPDVIRWRRQLSRAPLPPLHEATDDQRQ